MSPFKSQAQVRRFGAMVKRGEISQVTFDRWMAETKTPISSLPEKVGSKATKSQKKSKAKKR